MTKFNFNDGGRQASGRKGTAGDCGVRAMAIALNLPYDVCYKELAQANKDFGFTKSARNGIYKDVYEYVLRRHGWIWCKAPRIAGRKARCSDVPIKPAILRMAGHYSALRHDGIHDIWDCREKMVYGYWANP